MYQEKARQAVWEQGRKSRVGKRQDRNMFFDNSGGQSYVARDKIWDIADKDISIHYNKKDSMQSQMMDFSAYPLQMFGDDGKLESKDYERQEDIVAKVDDHTLHHIVPVNVINQMWNKWIDNGTWLENMEQVCDYYDGLAEKETERAAPDDIAPKLASIKENNMIYHVRELLSDVKMNIINEKDKSHYFEGANKDYLRDALGLVQWMPRNFVAGPTVGNGEGQRSPHKDPHDKFDIAAASLVANKANPEEAVPDPLKNIAGVFSDYIDITLQSVDYPAPEAQYKLYLDTLSQSYQNDLDDNDKFNIKIRKQVQFLNYFQSILGSAIQGVNDYIKIKMEIPDIIGKIRWAIGVIGQYRIGTLNSYKDFENEKSICSYADHIQYLETQLDTYQKQLEKMSEITSASKKMQHYITGLKKNKLLNWITDINLEQIKIETEKFGLDEDMKRELAAIKENARDKLEQLRQFQNESTSKDAGAASSGDTSNEPLAAEEEAAANLSFDDLFREDELVMRKDVGAIINKLERIKNTIIPDDIEILSDTSASNLSGLTDLFQNLHDVSINHANDLERQYKEVTQKNLEYWGENEVIKKRKGEQVKDLLHYDTINPRQT